MGIELHGDLKSYIDEDGFLLHPLVVMPWMDGAEEIAVHANRLYEHKTRLLKRYGNDYGKAIWLYETPFRWAMLLVWFEFGMIEDDVLAELILSVYATSAIPRDMATEKSVNIFRSVGFVSDDGSTRPTEPIRVYRGGHAEGMSWTTSLETAEWFAMRLGLDETVLSAIAPPEAILAIINGRGENEIVVDPSKLVNVRA